MPIICPKCGFKNTELDVYPDDECPQCGIIYNKYQNEEKKSAEQKGEFSKASAAPPKTAGNHFISIISKTWLWPIPLVLVQLLWLSFNYGKAKDPLGLLAAIVFFFVIYLLTYTPFFRYAQYASWYTKAPTEQEIGCIVVLFRIVVFLGLCFIMYLIISGKAAAS